MTRILIASFKRRGLSSLPPDFTKRDYCPPAENHHRDPQRGGRHRCNWPSYAPLLPVRKHRESDQPNRDDRRAGENKRLRGRLQVTKLRLSYA